MILWLLLAFTAILAGGVAAVIQIVRPHLDLLPLCWGAMAALFLGGLGYAVNMAGALVALGGYANDRDAAVVAMTRYSLFAALFHTLMITGVAVAALAVLTAVARSRTRRAAARDARPAEAASPPGPAVA